MWHHIQVDTARVRTYNSTLAPRLPRNDLALLLMSLEVVLATAHLVATLTDELESLTMQISQMPVQGLLVLDSLVAEIALMQFVTSLVTGESPFGCEDFLAGWTSVTRSAGW